MRPTPPFSPCATNSKMTTIETTLHAIVRGKSAIPSRRVTIPSSRCGTSRLLEDLFLDVYRAVRDA